MIRLLKPALILLAGTLYCTEFANAQEDRGGEQPHIREIRIHIANVYPPEQAEESSWASFTNPQRGAGVGGAKLLLLPPKTTNI
jgi:hypothetical protein